jgi:hypothetical protein
MIAPVLPARDMEKLSYYVEYYQENRPDEVVEGLRRLHQNWRGHAWMSTIRATALVVADLIEQGWSAVPSGARLYLSPPGLRLGHETVNEAKDRLRRSLQVGRERQLADPSVQRFLGKMTRRSLNGGRQSSVLEVIDRGPELAAALRKAKGDPAKLRELIDPVIEVCDESTRCTDTGIRLLDIWRYFRHTWSLEYRSIPGRQLPLLIRNRARPGRPVMGIAMLASPILRTNTRDNWIGWTAEAFHTGVAEGRMEPGTAVALLRERIETSLTEIRWDDLIPADEFSAPTERTLLRLLQRGAGAQAARARVLEEIYAERQENDGAPTSLRAGKKDSAQNRDWLSASEEHLFVRKRAETLADLLRAKQVFTTLDWTAPGTDLWQALTRHPEGHRAIAVALTEVRKCGLASQIADLSVCGAVAPYNALLGGKLVALLMASADVRRFWTDRYAGQISIISSQMAGRPISRTADLQMLTTTSLYGMSSSQYNRLRLRAIDHSALGRDINWQELDELTKGYGSVHLGPDTVRALRELSQEKHQAKRINHIFGEGTSPRLRQIREGLEVLGIKSDDVLHHATPRLFYTCELHEGARPMLLGLTRASAAPAPDADVIAEAWRLRWLTNRSLSADVLAQIAQFMPDQLAMSLVGPDLSGQMSLALA